MDMEIERMEQNEKEKSDEDVDQSGGIFFSSFLYFFPSFFTSLEKTMTAEIMKCAKKRR